MLEINRLNALPDIHRPLILVVDDTPTMLMVMSDILQSKYLVRVANNGKKGLDLAAKAKPALILLDILMPEMDGFEVCQQLKASEATKHIPVIFLTGKQSETEAKRCSEVGAVDFLSKPVEPTFLLQRIGFHLTQSDATISTGLIPYMNRNTD